MVRNYLASRSKAYVHHFTSEGMNADELPAALASCKALIKRYRDIDTTDPGPSQRLEVI